MPLCSPWDVDSCEKLKKLCDERLVKGSPLKKIATSGSAVSTLLSEAGEVLVARGSDEQALKD